MTSIESNKPGLLHVIAADIKIAHSVFALPFALLAAAMALAPNGRIANWDRAAGLLMLIVAAMFFARTAAMLANRYIDRRLDAMNPRTAQRAMPSGRMTPRQAVGAWLVAAGGFLASCLAFGLFFGNWWPAMLALPVLAWICAYGWTKRLTWMCHLYLGSSLALSPLASAIAVDPDAIMTQPALWLLSGMVLLWVAGFDVIYALQDVAIDRRDGLYSMPSRLGVSTSMWISRVLHVAAATALMLAWVIDDRFTISFGLGIGIVIVLLIYEHLTVSRWGTTKVALAFFTLNGVISCVLGALGVLDLFA